MAEVADFARNCQTGAPLASMKPYSAYFRRPRVHCVIARRFEATAARSATRCPRVPQATVPNCGVHCFRARLCDTRARLRCFVEHGKAHPTL